MSELLKELKAIQEEVGTSSIIHSDDNWCTNITVQDPSSPENPFWMQLFAGMLNFQYLDELPPNEVFPEEVGPIPLGAQLIGWEADSFCSYRVEPVVEEEVVAFIEGIFEKYYDIEKPIQYEITKEYL